MKFKQAVLDSWNNSWRLGFSAGVLGFLAQWVISTFKLAPILIGNDLVSVTASTLNIDLRSQVNDGIAPNLGKYFINLLGGLITQDVWNFIYFVVGSLVLFFLGRLAFDYLGDKIIFWTKNQQIKKVLAIILYSVLAGWVATFFLTGVVVGVAISLAMLLYYGLLSVKILIAMKLSKKYSGWISK
jgi:hypothetical protein